MRTKAVMSRGRRQRLDRHIRSENANGRGRRTDDAPRALMVLGMHRSGTSALTRIFSLLGADLPKNLMPASPANKMGYWESQDLMNINDEVLVSGGSTWDDWRAFNLDWFNSPSAGYFKKRLLEVLRTDFASSNLFAIKDPRICRLWVLWRDVLAEFGAKPLIVIPIRNPLEVAASIQQRDGIIPARTHLLWLRHVLEAESATRGLPRAITSFESLIEDWHSVIGTVASRLGLSWPRRGAMVEIEIEQFLSTQFKHHTIKRERLVDSAELMDWLKETYLIFEHMAENPESTTGMARLDQIRKAFDKASAAFGATVAMTEIELNKQKAAVLQLSHDLSIVRDTAAEREQQEKQTAASLAANLESTRADARDREVAAAEAEKRISELNERHAAIKDALEGAICERVQLAGELMSAQSTMRDLDAEIDRLGRDADATRLFLRESQSEVQRLAGEVDGARVELERVNAELQLVSDAFANKSKELILAHSRIQRLQGLIEDLQVTAAQESDQLRAEIATRGAEGERLRAELAKRGDQLDRITQQVSLMQKSKFWRLRSAVVRPIRVIHRLIGKIPSDKSEERRLIIASGLFDNDWYLAQYPDVKKDGIDPALHYLLFGGFEGRDPSPLYDTTWYLTNNPDVAAANLNPLIHYIKYGRSENRTPRNNSENDYCVWIDQFEAIDDDDRKGIKREINGLSARPLISILMPVYNTKIEWLKCAINSVQRQIYQNWELCLSDDASTDPKIREVLDSFASKDIRIKVVYREQNGHISENTNTALGLATGEFVALMDADDEISECALFWVIREINQYPDSDLIYSDEDKITENGKRYDPYFKPDWNPSLILSQNFFCHLGVYRRTVVNRVGGLRVGFEGSQDHDLVLRCAELTTAARIRHIPRVLYHWRATAASTATDIDAKPYAWEAGARSINEHLKRQRIAGAVKRVLTQYYQVEYLLDPCPPKVSIIIPTTCKLELLAPCLKTLLANTTYPQFEVLLVVNEICLSVPDQAAYLDALKSDQRVRILAYDNQPFNYARINNWAVRRATGSILCFLNDDIEIITEDWLEKIVARLNLPQVGAVGVMLYYPNDKIQHAGVILGLDGVAGHQFGGYLRGDRGYFGRGMLEQDLSCVTAACMGVSLELFNQLGGFNEEFVVAFNDVDLCIRIKQAGRRIIWTPAVEHYHHESASFGRPNSPERASQFKKEANLMRSLWEAVLDNDPAYNPNLSLTNKFAFRLAFPPRVAKAPETSKQASEIKWLRR